MKAMVLKRPCNLQTDRSPLVPVDLPLPVPKENEILVKVSACAVCHTELDEIEGRTPPARFPIILGHQIVGRVEGSGRKAGEFRNKERVGIAWIHSACGKCKFCLGGSENLCDHFRATGRDVDGGYAEYAVVPGDFAFRIPDPFSDSEAAPLLCAGAIGYRSLRLTGMQDGENLALIGFGASAHLVMKMVRHLHPDAKVFVFSRTESERDFARELGAFWVGSFDDEPPERMHCAIDTTPAWKPIIVALTHLGKGGRLIINAIRKEEVDKASLGEMDYHCHLWMEKKIQSVANVTRKDVDDFLRLAAQVPIRPEFQEYALEDANQALVELKERRIRGAKVLRIH